jgi:arylsulfatase A-like enzyme
MPTLLELAGVGDDSARQDGESLVPVLEGRAPERQARYLEFHPRIDQRVYNHTIVTEAWRLTLYPQSGEDWGELFDLRDDPGEHRNLFHDADYSFIRDRLTQRLNSDFPSAPEAGTDLIAKW